MKDVREEGDMEAHGRRRRIRRAAVDESVSTDVERCGREGPDERRENAAWKEDRQITERG